MRDEGKSFSGYDTSAKPCVCGHAKGLHNHRGTYGKPSYQGHSGACSRVGCACRQYHLKEQAA